MLEIDNLVVRYGGVHAIEQISVSIDATSVNTIIGSNGAGKTTLLNTISGLVPARSGTIRFDGDVLTGLKPERIVERGVVLVPEGRRLFPRMSVKDNLLMGGYLCRDDVRKRQNIDLIYTYFPVLERRNAQPAGLMSGGEQQMLAIGRAIMANPRVLLLDEPSTGLAPLMEIEVMRAVSQLARDQKVGIVLVEQNASLALKTAAYAYVLETGKITLHGPAAELSADPRIKSAYLGV